LVEIWGALPIAVGALVIVAVDVNAAITFFFPVCRRMARFWLLHS